MNCLRLTEQLFYKGSLCRGEAVDQRMRCRRKADDGRCMQTHGLAVDRLTASAASPIGRWARWDAALRPARHGASSQDERLLLSVQARSLVLVGGFKPFI